MVITSDLEGIRAFELSEMPPPRPPQEQGQYERVFYFLAPTATRCRVTGELKERLFGVKLNLPSDVSDLDIQKYRDAAHRSIKRAIPERYPDEAYEVAYRISECAPGLVLNEAR